MSTDKKAPILNKEVENEQSVPRQDAPHFKSGQDEKPSRGNKKDIPESNDPAGYDNEGSKKESPSGQRD